MKLTIKNYRAPSWNELYQGVHWATRKKIADDVHELVSGAIKEKHIDGETIYTTPVAITITAIYKKHAIDCDNIVAKLFIDPLKKLLIFDDTPKYVTSVTTISRKAKEDMVEIEIRDSL